MGIITWFLSPTCVISWMTVQIIKCIQLLVVHYELFICTYFVFNEISWGWEVKAHYLANSKARLEKIEVNLADRHSPFDCAFIHEKSIQSTDLSLFLACNSWPSYRNPLGLINVQTIILKDFWHGGKSTMPFGKEPEIHSRLEIAHCNHVSH